MANFETIVDSRTKTGAPALERELNVIINRIGTEGATPVVTFID